MGARTVVMTCCGKCCRGLRFPSQLVLHARNFGSLAAIRTGLLAGRGTYFGVIAADLQEPPQLLVDFLAPLVTNVADIVVGRREGREDPAATRISANLFWRLYRIFVNPDIPSGGVDLFGCNRQVRDELIRLEESHSSLVGLLFWVGFRRCEAPYVRRTRAHGKSSWTVAKKFTYLLDSVFAFTDLPVRLLAFCGLLGLILGVGFGITVGFLRLMGEIDVPGYAATIVAITFFRLAEHPGPRNCRHLRVASQRERQTPPPRSGASCRSFRT